MGVEKIEEKLEAGFETVGGWVARNPRKYIAGTFLFVLACAGGFSMLLSENRAEKQWVADGAPSLKMLEYVDDTWSSDMRFNGHIASCKDSGCNILDQAHLTELRAIYRELSSFVLDGEKIAKARVKEFAKEDKEIFDKYSMDWSLDGDAENDVARKCYAFGEQCNEQEITKLFEHDRVIPNAAGIKLALKVWESDPQWMCPVSISNAASPCAKLADDVDNVCQKVLEQEDCYINIRAYCSTTGCPSGVDDDTCLDHGCLNVPVTGTMPLDRARNFQLAKTLGNAKKEDGDYVSATSVFGFHSLKLDEVLIESDGATSDPISNAWEAEGLCVLGIELSRYDELQQKECKKHKNISFSALYGRSFGDAFGSAILGDLIKMLIGYVIMVVYLITMLSRRDPVHSMYAMSGVVVMIVLFSYATCFGICGYIGVPNNNLNGTITFILLGLGVDDAFVLFSEFVRAKKQARDAGHTLSSEDSIIAAAKHGGISVFITSLTDVLAFLVGSMTVIPALSWFCTFAGLGIMALFLFQLTFFLPCLLLNDQRANAGRRDCLCCCKVEPRDMDEPKGCCTIAGRTLVNCRKDMLQDFMANTYGPILLKSKPLKAVTILIFSAFTAFGLWGVSMIQQDFRIEWFIPNDSDVYIYIEQNDEMFSAGQPFSVYTKDMDYYDNQESMQGLTEYIGEDCKYIERLEPITDWHGAYVEWAKEPRNAASFPGGLVGDTITDETEYYTKLKQYIDTEGARYGSVLLWKHDKCNVNKDEMPDEYALCDPLQGLTATKISATMGKKHLETGGNRYDVMVAMRGDVDDLVDDNKAIVFGRDMLYWEENGVTREELTRNLAICAVIVAVIIFAMIPRPMMSTFVILCVILTVLDVVGYAHFFGVSISVVSSVYIMIAVGLSVDYSAHIAHMFKISNGDAEQRAITAVGRIGPSVFHAVITTLLAVVVLATSKSYVFTILFKVFFLTVIFGGIHGLWLLPVLLSIFGGDQLGEDEKPNYGADNVSQEKHKATGTEAA